MSDEKEFTTRYDALLRHYRLAGQKIQAGKANENGDVEQRHHRLKRAVEQAVLLRGSRDFASVANYREFLGRLVEQLNAGRRERLKAEMQYLRALPERRLESAKQVKVRVDTGSLIYVDRNAYSVNSRLIGEWVEARLKMETVEVWYAGRKVEEMARLRGRGNIGWTTATSSTGWCASPARSRTTAIATSCFPPAGSAWPGTACARRRQREPTSSTWASCKVAAQEGEAHVDDALRGLLEEGEIGEGKLSADWIRAVLSREAGAPPATGVLVAEVPLAAFDEPLGAGEATGVVQ